jgi:serine/threonine-protein kinase
VQKSSKEVSDQPVISRYRLLHFLQRGKTRSIYQAVDIHTAKPVALKLLRLDHESDDREQRLQSFARQMQSIIALDHPHILPILDFGQVSNEQEQKYDYVYIVMSLAAEGSLDIWLKNYWEKQKNLSMLLSLSDIQYIVSCTAQALQYAHDKDVLHLGIKPPNLLIRHRPDGDHFPHLELSDFSIALFTRPAQSSTHQEVPDAIAPEQIQGQVTAATDQYALAALVYEFLTGTAYTRAGQDKAHASGLMLPGTKTVRLTPAVHEILQRALSEVPFTRYPSIAEFAETFEQAMRRSEPGKHTHMVLGVSQAEALAGVSCPVVLPDKQQITIKVPPNAHAGQTLQVTRAGESSAASSPRGALSVTLAIRPTPNENQSVVEQLRHLSKDIQTLQTQPTEKNQQLQQQLETLDRKVTHIFNAYGEEEVRLHDPGDFPDYIRKHLSPGLVMVLTILVLTVLLGNCVLITTLNGAIARNGSTNIQAIAAVNYRLTATASTYAQAQATATGIAQATATAAQANAVQNATNSQSIPAQYNVVTTDNTNLIFSDLTYTSNIGNWSQVQQGNIDDQSCYFGENDNLYHAQMITKHSTPYFCQTSTAAGTVSTGPSFVLQVQMTILTGDVGGVAFGIAGKSFCYFYISSYGQYEAGVNNVPFSPGPGQSSAIHKGIGPNTSNLLAVVANNTTLTFYVNLQPVFSVQGIQVASPGELALVARSDGSPTNIGYQKIKIWRY